MWAAYGTGFGWVAHSCQLSTTGLQRTLLFVLATGIAAVSFQVRQSVIWEDLSCGNPREHWNSLLPFYSLTGTFTAIYLLESTLVF
jgi:hypothetical protein